MEENTVILSMNTEDCTIVQEVHYLKITLPKKELLVKYLTSTDSIEQVATLTSGVLSKIENSVALRMFQSTSNGPYVALFVKFSPASNTENLMVTSNPTAVFTDSDNGPLNGTSLSFLRSPPQLTPLMAGYQHQYEYQPVSGTSWPVQECVLTFRIPITYRKLPRFEAEPQVILGDEASFGKLDPTAWFNSKTFSDVVVECSSRVYHAHQIVLAGNSPVFRAMLTHPTKEAEKGRIVIKDVEPEIFETLLRFIYTGKVNPDILEVQSDELYRAADQYDVKDLLLLCEVHLLQNVTPEIALLMYDLAQCRPKSALAQKSRAMIQRNRSTIAADVNSFKNFTIKYPELIFEIFTS